MNKNRVIGLIVGASLIVAVILISLGFKAAPQAQGSSSAAVGMGDVQRVGAQPSIQKSSSTYVGMGDLSRLEAQKATQGKSSSYVGRGDFQRFEASQAVLRYGPPGR